ncbi:hypothetical protein BRC82_02460 [Halobacteriales archaeon QS_1_67_19]|nr:MAG: hypothetical protein BRC82_02460 [Halobacteriales archaeon QS_1_67_19]
MFLTALRYPFRTGEDRSALDVVLIGGGLHLLAALVPVVPLIAVAGYLVRVLAQAAGTDPGAFRTESSPPSFRGIGRLFVDGLAAIAVATAYLSVPAGVLAVTVRGIGAAPIGVDPSGPAGVGFLAGSTVTLFAVLAFAYPLPAALTAYARARRLRAAFELDRLWPALTDARYFAAAGAGGLWFGVALALAGPVGETTATAEGEPTGSVGAAAANESHRR